ncbi:unnamed protein product [Taenia asiatica]|uniref:Uncharacterized protein n=1 Tax=Taenia asiatica TaxID=60517 RepID=A0A0R3W0T2_TAEAS|nr:unnamed protein product [Taenia asiatica]
MLDEKSSTNTPLATEPSLSAFGEEVYSLNQHNPHHCASFITPPMRSARRLLSPYSLQGNENQEERD